VPHRELILAVVLLLLCASSWRVAAQTSPPPVTPPPSTAAPSPATDAGIDGAAPADAAVEPDAAEAITAEPLAPDEPIEVAPAALSVAASDREDEVQELVVTGSRIKRSPTLAESAPVEVVDRKQLERIGASNVSDVIQTLTAAQGSGYQGGGNPGNQGGGATGTSSINLRGLGAASTLVLVNGRRMVPSGGGGGTESFADVGVIPLAAVERIEVLKGGGSAIYGADAVGGVVNIITRPAFDGLRLELDGQGTTRADHGEFTGSGSWGAKTERSRVLLSLSYMRRSELRSNLRDFSRNANVDPNGGPGTFIIPGFNPTNPAQTRFADPSCSQAPGSMLTHPIVNGMPTADELCSLNFSKAYSLIAGVERVNVFGTGSYDLTKHASVFGEVQMQRSRTNLVALPSYSIPPPLLTIPADHVDNPFGRAVTFVGRPFGLAYSPQQTSLSDDTYRAVVGVRGDLEGLAPGTIFDDWEWDVTGSWGVSRFVSFVSDTLRGEITNAARSCSDPTNLSGCFNPFYSAIDGTGTPNTQSVIDRVLGTYTNVSEHFLHTYHAGMTGSLFQLPGGPVGIAFGGELRHERRQTQVDHDATQENYTFFLGSADAAATRDVYSAYTELRWPFFRGIELQTAIRVEHYTDIDRTTPSPFAGLTMSPAELVGPQHFPAFLRKLRLSGQVTSAFRAPTLYQANPGFAVVPTALRVAGAPLPVYIPVQNFGNPSLEPESALIYSAGVNWLPVDAVNLTADLWHYDYQNRIALEPAQQALDLDVMSRMSGGEGDPRVVRDPATGNLERVQLTQRNIPGHIKTTGIDMGLMLTLTGASFGGSASDFGAISFGAQGTLTLSYTIPRSQAARRTVPNTSPPVTFDPLNCNANTCEAVGSRNYNTIAPPLPRWRINFPLAWSFNGHTASVITRFISSVANDNDVAADGSLGELKSMVTFDLQYGYAVKDWIAKELSFRIGVYNVFDKLPPPTRDTNGFESMLYDPRGRIAYARLVAMY